MLGVLKLIKILLLTLTLYAASAVADFTVYPYAAIGIGYKLHESNISVMDSRGVKTYPELGNKDTALFEAGFETDYNTTFGIKHDSQYSTGWPFNDDPEYYKTEIFIRYKIGGRP